MILTQGGRAKRKRKPRGQNQHGGVNYDLCGCCLWPHCDPFTMSARVHDKLLLRKMAGLCPACGHLPCTCRSGGRS
jgi:hypothetical protein